MNNVIEARGLTKRYKRTVAVDNIDLEIPSGRIVGLIGPNGAGNFQVNIIDRNGTFVALG